MIENEYLTDAATIHTGLGKLTMNGCRRKVQRREVDASGRMGTKTQTRRLGYYTAEEFAFRYAVWGVSHGFVVNTDTGVDGKSVGIDRITGLWDRVFS